MSTMLNALLLYPDHPYQLGELWGFDINPVTRAREEFLIARTRDLDPEILQAKERKLVELVKEELQEGRRCQLFAVYTGSMMLLPGLLRSLPARAFALPC